MQVITVSRGSYCKGKELAECLARKLDFDCLSRESLFDEATRQGIPVGRLEMAIVRPALFNDQMRVVLEAYQALAAKLICERAFRRGLVYHGRTGHLILPGVEQVLRIRVVADMETRIRAVMARLGLGHDKAAEYIETVERDRRKWVQHVYHLEWDIPSLYDIVINVEQMSVENASSALVSLSQLPDFQPTPASRRKLGDLHLAAASRVRLFEDERTCGARFSVHSEGGKLSVTYQPHEPQLAELIPQVLEGLEGIHELVCTMARTNLLWIQERFDPASEVFGNVLQLANKWDAAVELLQLGEGAEAPGGSTPVPGSPAGPPPRAAAGGGIEDDVEEAGKADAFGVSTTREALVLEGRSAGSRSVAGGAKNVLHAINKAAEYSLVIVGDLFLEKAQAVRKRETRDLVSLLSDALRAPVVQAEHLEPKFLFARGQYSKLAFCLATSFVLYLLVFTNQETVLRFFAGQTLPGRLGHLVTVAILMGLVPLLAYLYGTASHLLLKLVRIE